ncbi:MAG: DUF971 domain-containing protein [Pirellulaceae bacterium]|nr:DUF971 domain-containing protein [Pirellulaceae bacterium]
MLQPTALALVEDRYLQITWSDGEVRRSSFGALRKACPCATCREKKRADASKKPNLLPVLSAAEAQPLKIVAMRPVGNYAYNIDFSDGHGSGLFTIELLRELGTTIEG